MPYSAAVPSPDGDRRAVVVPPRRTLPRMRTARLVLTPVRANDLDALFALHSDPRAFERDSTPPLRQRAQMRHVLVQWCRAWVEHGQGYFAVRAREDLARETPLPTGLLGVVGLTVLPTEEGAPLSAYWRLRPEVTGRGVAYEAMRAVLADPRCGAPGREVIAVTAARNLPSRTLAARLGFRPAPARRSVPGGRAGDVLLVRPAPSGS